ncbi:Pkinase-domain-containing protein [Sodiomyces alkalinus F11]|uniref:non-specific serine/threonine protein kinase n=1 Tax=Sodiomyces alkalinus (strain CBS 110278 / VKM F-3762 / F11) TaxID=1314773 RepID=A0A3N2PVI7_SODAK|nr:Pkinase-domain-containing protein [Sodiomyces alkalinus F11]ROT38509.1 Pkinase-domain-containing protein [Sodiomyces alkalinus F11]
MSSAQASGSGSTSAASSKPSSVKSSHGGSVGHPPAVIFEPQPRPAERSSVKERFARIFAHSARSTPSNATPRASSFEDSSVPPSKKPSPPPRNPSTSTADKATASLKPAKPAAPKEPQRFTLDPEAPGGHVHHLKSSRRQEKLLDMLRMLLGRKQEIPDNDLSLVSNWVGTAKEEAKEEEDKEAKEAVPPEKKGANATAVTLAQKYGKCQEVVGRGAFGIVRISHKKSENGVEKLYAVKEFRRRPEESEKKFSKRLTSEFCISSSLRHPNVIHTLDLIKDAKGDYCEVMEFCAGGDLYTLVLSAGRLEVQEADCFFKQMMRGVEYLHEMGVAHRDLKPENLLLTTRGALKITDFGNGECFRMAWETDPHMVSGLCGSAPYIAPEEYIDKEFDARAVDVWACGVIYMAMRTGRHLWRVARKDEDEFYARYLAGRRDEEGYAPIESLQRARCRNVIYSILDPSPSRRITASQVLKSEWGREIKLCKAGEEGL